MARFQIEGRWYDANTYAEAREAHRLATAVAPVPAFGPVPVAPPVNFSATVTPVDNFAGRSATQFGVGEEIDLGFSTIPVRTAASFGGLLWHVKSGPARLDTPLPNDGTARLVMGDSAGAVVLELRTIGAVPQVKATKTLWVIEPSSAVIVQDPGTAVFHTNGTASAGFKGLIRFRPTTVSFYRCQFREGTAPIKATGSLQVSIATSSSTSASTGQRTAVAQELGNLQGSRHPVMGTWMDISNGHSVNGSQMVGFDSIRSVTVNPPYAAGTFDWEIQWFWRVIGSAKEKFFQTAVHSEAITTTGQMTISKGGTVIVCQPGDPTTNF